MEISCCQTTSLPIRISGRVSNGEDNLRHREDQSRSEGEGLIAIAWTWVYRGGWNSSASEVYYADSATTLWSAVPPFSWFDAWTFVVILGGRGYVW